MRKLEWRDISLLIDIGIVVVGAGYVILAFVLVML